jgi:nitrile hydratase accessory protein
MISREISEPEGAPLPRKNGELVFEAPWEGRAFGLAVALNDAGHYPWDAFRDHLIANIDDERAYYDSWLSALEKLLLERGVIDPAELEERTNAIRSGERDDVF